MYYMCSNELPQPISKRKDKEYKKKKSKTVMAFNVKAEADLKMVNALPKVASYNVAPANAVLDKKPGLLRFTKAGNECTRIVHGSSFVIQINIYGTPKEIL